MNVPYVGPSPFSAEQTLFGRDADIEQLQWRLISDRIIVLYSPSGAGKTSLLMAKNGLLSTLTTLFHVLPVLRIAQAYDTDPVNSLLQRLDQDSFGPLRPDDTLLTYFNRIPLPESDPPKRLLLVLDQFEEVLTGNVPSEKQKAFFQQLKELLSNDDRTIWLIISMREEYFSWLDDFRDDIPTRLNNTYRLNLLSVEQAVAAIKGPAEAMGVAFPEQDGTDAAQVLVSELIKAPEGARPSKTVEPVQLQVVCTDLWNTLSQTERQVCEVRVADVTGYNPDNALLDYCTNTLNLAAQDPHRRRTLGDWIDRYLLTLSGRRSAVIFSPQSTDGPSLQEIQKLEEHHLIRRQSREDGMWYELAHDRLASPVRRSIEEWRNNNLKEWQKQAHIWHMDGEKTDYFRALPYRTQRKMRLAESDAPDSKVEARFLAAYASYRRRKRQLFCASSLVIAVLAIIIGFFVDKIADEQQKTEAEQQKTKLGLNYIAIQTGILSILNDHPIPSLEALATAAGAQLRLPANSGNLPTFKFQTFLGDYLGRYRQLERIDTLGDGKTTVVRIRENECVSAKIGSGRYSIKSCGENSELIPLREIQQAHPKGIAALAFVTPQLLAIGDINGTIRIWDLTTKKTVGAPLNQPVSDKGKPVSSKVRTITATDNWLFAGYQDGTLATWKISEAKFELLSQPTKKKTNAVMAIAATTPKNALDKVAIATSMTVKWQTFSQGKPQQSVPLAAIEPETEYSKTFYSIDISPDGRFIAAGSRDGYIYIWDTSHLSPTKNNVEKDVSPRADAPLQKSSFSYSPTIINAHQQTVAQLKYLQNGDLLSLSWDGSLKLWPFSNNNAAAPANRTLLQFPRQLVSVATEPDEQNAYVTSEAGDILRVNLRVDRHPFGQFLLSSRAPALFVDGTENRQIFTVQATGLTQYRLDANTGQPTRLRQLPVSDVVALAWSPSTVTLFAAQQQGVTVFRNILTSPSNGEPLACLRQPPGRRIVAIRVNDAGSLLAITLVGKNGRKPANKLYRLTASAAYGFTCQEIKTPSGIAFPLPWFRPDSEEIITVSDKNKIVSWVFNPKSRDTLEFVPSRTILAQNALSDTLGPIETLAFDASGSTLLLSNFSGKIYSTTMSGEDWSFTQKKNDSFFIPHLLAASGNDIVAMADNKGQLSLIFAGSAMRIVQDFHITPLTALAISQDGKWLVSSSSAGTAIWDLRMESWVKQACKLANRQNFDREEINKYFHYASINAPCPDNQPK
ncbi:hypothetical protein I5L12_00865 [Serratia marcescens]|uniref:NACHT and WD repeat domain-containing protein n=1 Tax=Serratia TaxID=613 RepID=UPI001330C9A2|nr:MULTISPECIES: AAA family ATPase [Serratia]MBH2680174.1 hypothetical protein [Serratia marcescens]MBH2704724.1 hypothetical protein [Serratia marcescens]MDI3149008.1 AAA family ATPase [Serratia nevei]SMP46172.1 WD40 repeat [Serratia sp. CC22-02]